MELNATVVSRRDPSERLAIVSVRPDGWELPVFEPGQFATLGLPDPEGGAPRKRVYSIASAPGQPALEFYVQLVKEGSFTTLLWPHQPGDRIHLSPTIAGRFTLQSVPRGADLLLVGTGTGIAPFVSMLRHHAGRGRWRRCIIAHGARSEAELGYRAELETLAAADPSVIFLPVVSRAPAGTWGGLTGRVQTLLDDTLWSGPTGADQTGADRPGAAADSARASCSSVSTWPPGEATPLDPSRCHVFLCGNPAMIDDMDALLSARGFRHNKPDAPGNLHFERWW